MPRTCGGGSIASFESPRRPKETKEHPHTHIHTLTNNTRGGTHHYPYTNRFDPHASLAMCRQSYKPAHGCGETLDTAATLICRGRNTIPCLNIAHRTGTLRPGSQVPMSGVGCVHSQPLMIESLICKQQQHQQPITSTKGYIICCCAYTVLLTYPVYWYNTLHFSPTSPPPFCLSHTHKRTHANDVKPKG